MKQKQENGQRKGERKGELSQENLNKGYRFCSYQPLVITALINKFY